MTRNIVTVVVLLLSAVGFGYEDTKASMSIKYACFNIENPYGDYLAIHLVVASSGGPTKILFVSRASDFDSCLTGAAKANQSLSEK